VTGIHRAGSRLENLQALSGRIRTLAVDLDDAQTTRSALAGADYEVVFHLAAQSNVPASWRDPEGTIVNNLRAELHLVSALAEMRAPGPLLVLASSAHVYGTVAQDSPPIDETQPLRPADPYAFSKVAQEFLAIQYEVSHGLRCVRLRLFNHLGPRQNTSFALPDFAQQIAEAEAGRREPVLRVGALDARRDFTDVRDIARAYRLAAERGAPGSVYNVGSGRALAIRDLLDRLVALARIPIELAHDESRLRPTDAPVLESNSGAFHNATGWQPEIPLEETLRDTLDYWRRRVGALASA
jgi:GDP-4-dehydro-6-deoxy-D-mannose reductase